MTANVTTKILERIVLVKISIRGWMGETSDKDLARAIEKAKGMKDGTTRASVYLIPDDYRLPIVNAKSVIRGWWYANTIPYDNDGWRMVSVDKFQILLDTIAEMKRTVFDPPVTRLLEESDRLRTEAIKNLGSAYDAEKFDSAFPTSDKLVSRYDVDVETEAFSDPNHLLIKDIDKETVEDMRETAARRQAERVSKGVRKVVENLRDIVREVRDRVQADPKKAKYKNLFESLKSTLAILPDLNVLRDPDLDKLITKTREKLGSLDLQALREEPAQRKTVKKVADDIIDDLDNFAAAL